MSRTHSFLGSLDMRGQDGELRDELTPSSAADCRRRSSNEGAEPEKSLSILVVVEDCATAEYVIESIKDKAIRPALAVSASDGLKRAATQSFDVLVVDSRLSDMDGASLISTLRNLGTITPCLLLTGQDEIDVGAKSLGEAADDFLVKPFAIAELYARLSILARRPRALSQPTTLRFADLEMNLLSRQVMRGGRSIHLPPRQFELLELLMRNRGRVLSCRSIVERLSTATFDGGASIVQANICRLRARIDRDHEAPLIRTIRGVGYGLQAL